MKIIGMISGTSFDAIEAVAIDIVLRDHVMYAELRGHESVPYADELRPRIAQILPPASTTIDEVCRLDTLIGQAFADVAVDLSDRYFEGDVDVVCSHGQTVFHWVDQGRALGTLQIGQGAWIAEATGATVVADVRSRDVAAGGQGAPLASLIDVLLLGRHSDTVRGALNLGGISNITVVFPQRDPVAYDIGPANALMDAAVAWWSNGVETFDCNGEGAAAGTVDKALLQALLAEPYYGQPAPKSTGKELFHLGYLQRHLAGRDLQHNDVLATLLELTVTTISDAVAALGVRELFVSGGGTRNQTLMGGLTQHLRGRGVTLALIDEFGLPEAAKEAVLFAVIGFLTVQGLDGTVASATGAHRSVVLGAIIPGRQPITTMAAQQSPYSLVFLSPESTS